MNKKEFFLEACKQLAIYDRECVLRMFSVTADKSETPYYLMHHPDKVTAFVRVDPNSDTDHTYKEIVIEDLVPYDIPYVYHESTGPLKKGDVINLDRDIADSTWGVLLINVRVLGFACGDLIPFMEGPFTPKDIEKIFVKRMKDNPPEGEPKVPGELYVEHWMNIGKAVGDLDGFELIIPSVTERMLQPYPDVDKHREEIFARYTPDELRDPVIQARIEKEMVDRYKEWIKEDPSEGFVFKDKTISTALKRMFLIHGPEAGFHEGGEATLVPQPLDKGIDVDYFPEMINSMRNGAYSRGALTALAGTDVDLVGRIFANSRIDPNFCGTKQTVSLPVTNRMLLRWMSINGKRTQLTNDNIGQFINSKQEFYDPAYCITEENDLCAVCCGGQLAAYPTSLGSSCAEKQSVLMYVMMGAAHAKALKTIPLKEDWLE